MISKNIVTLFFMITLAGKLNSAAAENFIIKKKTSDTSAHLSKDALKEHMGDAVRDGLHLLFDNATHLIAIQKHHSALLQETCALHEKIIVLQRKFSHIAESLIEGHFVYKKNHKKRLATSLSLLKTSVATFKQIAEQLQIKTPANMQQHLASMSTSLGSINEKITTDTCLKAI